MQALADHLSNDCPNPELKPQALHRLSGFSRSYVNAMFRKYIGETPREYLHRCRVRLAMERLTGNPEVPLSEVAEICGYSTQSLFNRHFRRLTGMAPGQFRLTHAGQLPPTHGPDGAGPPRNTGQVRCLPRLRRGSPRYSRHRSVQQLTS